MSFTHTLINDFTYADPKTLAGKKGEEFIVTNETGGWCTCINAAGKSGLIPSTYLKALPAASSALSADGEYVEGLYDYPGNPQDSRVLPFKQKDVMKVLKKSEGWWTCEIVSTGKSGLCPQTYLKLCLAPAATAPAPAPAPATATPTPAPAVTDDGDSRSAVSRGVNPLAAAAAGGLAGLRKASSASSTPVSPGPASVTTPASAVVLKPVVKAEEPKPDPKPVVTQGVVLKPTTSSSLISSPAASSSSSSSSPSSSSTAQVQKSLQTDDLASLLSTFNALQQEANQLLKQQTSDLVETKELVKRILQVAESRYK